MLNKDKQLSSCCPQTNAGFQGNRVFRFRRASGRLLHAQVHHFGLAALLFVALLVTACSGPAVVNPTATLPATPTNASTATAQPTQTTAPTGTNASMGSMTVDTPSANASPMIKVSDQSLVNGMVKVDEVVSDGPGWVVIYTTKANQQPDQLIGHAPVKDGDNKNVMVPVDPAKAQGPLYAQLQADKGTVGAFEFPGVDQPVMVGVQMIANTFLVSPAQASSTNNTSNNAGNNPNNSNTNNSANSNAGNNANNNNENNMNMGSTNNMPNTGGSNPSTNNGPTPALVIANQPIVDGKVVVAQVIANGDTWVVIHRKNGDGTMGGMVGYTRVKSGDNRNVVVQLDTSSTSSTMFAMLHKDVAKAASPQFPGVDVPVDANGQVISPSFDITSNGSSDTVISLGNTPGTVSYLVNAQDMSLYISLQDTPGKSNCTGDCLNNWHPLLATGRIIAGVGVQGNKLGIALLQNGNRQVTYLGSPLYTFSGDKQPGDVNGQGVDGNWYLVTP